MILFVFFLFFFLVFLSYYCAACWLFQWSCAGFFIVAKRIEAKQRHKIKIIFVLFFRFTVFLVGHRYTANTVMRSRQHAPYKGDNGGYTWYARKMKNVYACTFKILMLSIRTQRQQKCSAITLINALFIQPHKINRLKLLQLMKSLTK